MVEFHCDSCGYERKLPDELIGRKVQCPQCKVASVVDSPSEPLTISKLSLDQATDLGGLASDRAKDEYSEPDIICTGCGSVVSGDGGTPCEHCGTINSQATEYTDISEDDVDVSDLAEDTPHVWDEGFDGAEKMEESLDQAAGRSGFHALARGGVGANIFAGVVSGGLCVFFAIALTMLLASQGATYRFYGPFLSVLLLTMGVGGLFYSFFPVSHSSSLFLIR